MLKLGDRTQHGKVIAVLWIGERYYSFDNYGVICLVPGVIAERDRPDDPIKCVRIAECT